MAKTSFRGAYASITVVRKGKEEGSSSSSALKGSCFVLSTQKVEPKVLKQKPEGQFVKEKSDEWCFRD